ncbi:MAG: ABC transporter substrate-binding protein, partial [Candidatus Aminicenantes bacterium]|nr:ABC transporter substrate-binding protein [Candidatus Aminicenantes bacterium]
MKIKKKNFKISCMIPAVFLNCLILAAAIKINYGGEVAIRLNEPATFAFSPSDYSNLVFYSLIYENFFYLKNNGDIRSNIFENYSYDNQAKTLSLSLKDNLSFSNGTAVTARDVRSSLRSFLDYDLASAKKIRSIIKSIKQVDENQVQIELLYDNPGFAGLLTAPELVLLPLTGQTYSGIF